MILYSLACDAGHRFDSWFRDSAAFEDQAARDFVVCPTCASTRVAKTIMAPAIVGGRAPMVQEPDVATPTETATDVALLDPKRQKVRALLKELRDKVVADGVDVGASFPEEARRIHHGEAPTRQIYGQATIAEARDLVEDGIMVLPLPIVSDDLN